MNKSANRSALYLICLATVLLGCSREQAPPPPPAPSPTPATTQPKPKPEPKKKELSHAERLKAIAADKFELFERKIKVADFPRAEATLRDLKSAFALESEYKRFWDKAIPLENRAVLTLMSLCETCKDGKCTTCRGVAKCGICKGTGQCTNCAGRPVREQACRSCICAGCSGTGKCRTCAGFKTMKCRACLGYGSIGGMVDVNCKRCGGSGNVPGLRGSSGRTTLRCLTCNGKGKVKRRALSPCQGCSGKGTLACNSCGGAGKCAKCKGAGRDPNCKLCSGTMVIVHKCPKCEGTGKCINCQGSGQCTKCHGSGKCFECEGGLVAYYNLPVNTKWVTMKEGYVLFDSRLDKVVEKSDKAGFKQIEYKDVKLSVIVDKGQIVFIATQPAFDSAARLIRK